MEKVWVVEFEELMLRELNAVFSTKEKAKNYVEEWISELQSNFEYHKVPLMENVGIVSREEDAWITWEYQHKDEIYSIIVSEYEIK